MINGRDKSGHYISRNELREKKDDESCLCDEQHALKPENDRRDMHETYTCFMRKMAIYCLCCRDPIYRVRRGGEGLFTGRFWAKADWEGTREPESQRISWTQLMVEPERLKLGEQSVQASVQGVVLAPA